MRVPRWTRFHFNHGHIRRNVYTPFSISSLTSCCCTTLLPALMFPDWTTVVPIKESIFHYYIRIKGECVHIHTYVTPKAALLLEAVGLLCACLFGFGMPTNGCVLSQLIQLTVANDITSFLVSVPARPYAAQLHIIIIHMHVFR